MSRKLKSFDCFSLPDDQTSKRGWAI